MNLKDRLAALERRHPARLVLPATTEAEFIAARLAVEGYVGEVPEGPERDRVIAEAKRDFPHRNAPVIEQIRARLVDV